IIENIPGALAGTGSMSTLRVHPGTAAPHVGCSALKQRSELEPPRVVRSRDFPGPTRGIRFAQQRRLTCGAVNEDPWLRGPFEKVNRGMSVPLMLTFVTTVVFAIQLLIFAYLYSSHRVRFFRYLLLAWGAYTLSKGLKLVDVFLLHLQRPSFA